SQVYFEDQGCGDRILTIDSTGKIHVVATQLFYMNIGLEDDGSGNLLVPAQDGIYKVTPSGTVTTFAGQPGTFNKGNTGDGGPATSALFYVPTSVARDGSNIFIVDSYNQRSRDMKSDGNIYALQGPGNDPGVDGSPAKDAFVYTPQHVGVDSNHNVYVGGSSTSTLSPIKKIMAVGGTVSSSSPAYDLPKGLALDGETNGGGNPSENNCGHGC